MSQTILPSDIAAYNSEQQIQDRLICALLAKHIQQVLPNAAAKVWHGHPVWFLEDNPIVGYSKQKLGIRLMFWSGADFNEPELNHIGRKFKDASVFYNHTEEVNPEHLERWLEKSKHIQWDYKNIIKRKGELIKLK